MSRSIFGWSYPPGAASDPNAPWNQMEPPDEYLTATNNVKRLFRYFGAKSWRDIYRALYKGTNCGVSVGICINDYPEPVYCDGLYEHCVNAPVYKVLISSIVEGVDFDCDTVEVDLTVKGTRKTGDIVKRLFAAVQEVEAEAEYIWQQTHGCEHCGIEGEWGHNAINPDCPVCKGQGIII